MRPWAGPSKRTLQHSNTVLLAVVSKKSVQWALGNAGHEGWADSGLCVGAYLPRHGTLNRDASSVVNMMASIDFTGWKPESRRNLTAVMAPMTPSAPS